MCAWCHFAGIYVSNKEMNRWLEYVVSGILTPNRLDICLSPVSLRRRNVTQCILGWETKYDGGESGKVLWKRLHGSALTFWRARLHSTLTGAFVVVVAHSPWDNKDITTRKNICTFAEGRRNNVTEEDARPIPLCLPPRVRVRREEERKVETGVEK